VWDDDRIADELMRRAVENVAQRSVGNRDMFEAALENRAVRLKVDLDDYVLVVHGEELARLPLDETEAT
jgi:hypothetical protein